MDLLKSEYKEEDKQILVEFVETVALPYSDEKETGISYKAHGQIFISDKGILNFNCAHCGGILITINEFSMHLKNYHDLENWVFENEDDCVRYEICSENGINYSDDAECTNSDCKEIEESNFTHFDQIDHQFNSNDEDGYDKKEILNMTLTKERPDNSNVKYKIVLNENFEKKIQKKVISKFDDSNVENNGDLKVNFEEKIQKKVVSKFDCEYCGRNLHTKQKLDLHVVTYHEEAKQIKNISTDIVCTVCNKSITSEASMANHKAVCSSDYFFNTRVAESAVNDNDISKRKSKSYKCKYCDRKFNIPSERQNHEYTHTGEKPFKCEICSKAFRKRFQYRTHLMVHKNIRPYKCDLCNFSCTLKSNLLVHKRRHTGEKRFKCDYCDKTFVSSIEKKTHERRHTGDKPYKCHFCEESFPSNTQVARHILKYHSRDKPFKCDICGKVFGASYELKYHAVIHEEKKFECEICGAKLLRKKFFKIHMKVHENNKSFLCSICGKTFSHKNGLNAHMKIHSKSEIIENKN